MNVGEKGEILFKIKLIQMRDNKEKFFDEYIVDVGYPDNYKELTDQNIKGLLNLNDNDLIEYAGSLGVKKTGSYDKADVYINKVGYSLKATYGANSTLINHTTRPGFERVCKEIDLDIETLDEIIDKYWELRLSGKIGEDVSNSNPLSPFKNYKIYFGKILSYFLFKGTGSRQSKHPAKFIIEYKDPLDVETWNVLDEEDVIDAIWDNLVFSLRSKKGMPDNYTLDYNGRNANSIAKWVRYCNSEYKGALHVRVGK